MSVGYAVEWTDSRVCDECDVHVALGRLFMLISTRLCPREAVWKKSTDIEYHGCKGAWVHLLDVLFEVKAVALIQTIADVIRTCLGPKAMLKMILDPMGGIL